MGVFLGGADWQRSFSDQGQGGQGDAWQVPTIGYGLPGDLVAPKNLGEEYRRNAQIYYYACDANFLDFFGSNGVVAISQALLHSEQQPDQRGCL